MSDLELFKKELQQLISKHSIDNMFNTKDLILVDYLVLCLKKWNIKTHNNIEIMKNEPKIIKSVN